jgi:hypothetical protein
METRNAERVRLRAEGDKLRTTDPAGLADAWARIDGLWSGTVARARAPPEPILHEQVDGEMSTDHLLRPGSEARYQASGPW